MRQYVVAAGDSPARIATVFAGCPKCAVDLVAANPQKPRVQYANGFTTFTSLRAGELLALPDAWFDGTLDRAPPAYFDALPSADGRLAAPPGQILKGPTPAPPVVTKGPAPAPPSQPSQPAPPPSGQPSLPIPAPPQLPASPIGSGGGVPTPPAPSPPAPGSQGISASIDPCTQFTLYFWMTDATDSPANHLPSPLWVVQYAAEQGQSTGQPLPPGQTADPMWIAQGYYAGTSTVTLGPTADYLVLQYTNQGTVQTGSCSAKPPYVFQPCTTYALNLVTYGVDPSQLLQAPTWQVDSSSAVQLLDGSWNINASYLGSSPLTWQATQPSFVINMATVVGTSTAGSCAPPVVFHLPPSFPSSPTTPTSSSPLPVVVAPGDQIVVQAVPVMQGSGQAMSDPTAVLAAAGFTVSATTTPVQQGDCSWILGATYNGAAAGTIADYMQNAGGALWVKALTINGQTIKVATKRISPIMTLSPVVAMQQCHAFTAQFLFGPPCAPLAGGVSPTGAAAWDPTASLQALGFTSFTLAPGPDETGTWTVSGVWEGASQTVQPPSTSPIAFTSFQDQGPSTVTSAACPGTTTAGSASPSSPVKAPSPTSSSTTSSSSSTGTVVAAIAGVGVLGTLGYLVFAR